MAKFQTSKSAQIPNKSPSISVENKTTTPFSLSKWLPLTFILLTTFLLHLQYLDIPLERDESFYAYVGKLALNGGKPYIDFYEMKPPMLFYSYAFLVGVFGYSATGVHLAVAALAVLNTLFVFLIMQKLSGKKAASLAATAYAVWSMHGGIYGIYLMGETIALAWSLPAVILALNYSKNLNKLQLFAVGSFTALAFLTKQTAAVVTVPIGLYWLSDYWLTQRKTVSFLSFFKSIGWTFLGFFLPISLMTLILWAIGSGQEAIFWLFDYPKLYSSAVNAEDAAMAFDLMKRLVFTDYEGYFIAAILGVIAVIVSKKQVPEKVLLISWAILTVATVGLGNRFYGHYWQYAIPPLAILGTLFFQEIYTKLYQKMGKLEAIIALIGASLWSIHIVFIQPSYYFNPPLNDISQKFSPGNPYVEDKLLADYIQKITQPSDRIAVFGAEPQYFIYWQKPSPIRHVYMPFFVNGSYPRAMRWQNETLEDLKTSKPEYVVFNKYPIAWMYQPNNSQWLYAAVYTYVMESYDLVAFVEYPGENKSIEVKTPTNGGKIVAAATYIAVLKRR
jgi:hypothetical protein